MERLSPDLNSFLQLHLTGARKKSHIKKIRISLREKREQQYSLEHYAHEIYKLIRTKHSKTAFSLVSRLTILHPTKRDGGIMNFYLSDDDQLCVGQDHVILNCLKHLQDISGIGPETQVRDTDFPTLAPLSRLQVTELQAYCSQRKGLTFDGFSDIWVKNTWHFELLSDLWNQTSINQLCHSFEA